jgi:transcriptional regulator with XRE-family HTH domain
MVDTMSNIMDGTEANEDINGRIARRVRELRAARQLSLEVLAGACGVSRSMISLIERGESSPTAAVLDKLASGLGVPLASLFDDPAPRTAAPQPLARRDAQPEWRDPQSGYVRRNLSPPSFPSPIHLVEVRFPPRARVAFDSGPRDAEMHQQIWMLDGALELSIGDDAPVRLQSGDCLAMRLDRPTVFRNPGRVPAHYLVAIVSATALGNGGHG